MKMKTLALICLLACGLFSVAQTDSVIATADYDFSHIDDTTQKHFPRTDIMRLYIGKNMSYYTSHARMLALMRTISSNQADPGFVNELKRDMVIGNIYKNSGDGKLTYIAPAGFNSYIIEEPIPVIKWEIRPDTRIIEGYSCQKATASFRGRNYEAWFCGQIPFSNGPWKLGGLPGLILEAYDLSRDVKFVFKGFSVTTDIPTFALPQDFKKITAREYQAYIDAMNKDTQAMIGAAKTSGGTVMSGVSKAGSGPPRRIKILNNPIEKTKD